MSVSAQLSVRHGRAAVEFYEEAFGAREVYRVGGTDEHEEVVAQLAVGDTSLLGRRRVARARELQPGDARRRARCGCCWSSTTRKRSSSAPSRSAPRESGRSSRGARLAARPDRGPVRPPLGDRQAAARMAAVIAEVRAGARLPCAACGATHVTTFGCQMNAHDSERIKGLLEELGLGEAQTPDDADVVVFNTCTIREKPDTKLAAYLGEATARKREDPGRVIAVGGCYAEAQRERIFELYPGVDVAFGPGLDRASRRVARRRRRGGRARPLRPRRPRVRRRAADAPRAGVPGVGAGVDGLQLDLLVLHRPGRPRPRDVAAAGRDRRRGHAARARGRPRGDAARPERQLLGPRPAARRARRVRRAAARLRRVDGHRAHPLHEPAPEGLPRPGDRRDRRVRRRLRARAPAAPVRLDADPQGDAPHVLARALPGARRRSCAPRSPTSRSAPTSSSASRARPRTTSARRSRSSRRSATTARSRSSTRRGRAPTRRRCPTRFRTRSRSSAWSASSS